MAEPVKFQISSIRTELELDFARYSEEIRLALEACLKSGGTTMRLAEVIHAAHAIRGVSSLVGAWALAFWCEDMERLARAATQDLKSDAPRASLVIRFLYDHREVMSKLGRMSLAEEFDNALTDYAGIRSRMPLVVRELTSAKLEADGMPSASSMPVRPPIGEPNSFVPTGRKTNNLPLPPSARRAGDGSAFPRAAFTRATPSLTTDEERRPYLAEARFYLARVDGILRTDVMPAKTADLWTVLARLFSSLEFYCLSLGNARILELVDKAQQLTLRAVEDPVARTEGTRLALAEYHFILSGEFDAQESGQPELSPIPVATSPPVILPPSTRRASRRRQRSRLELPERLNLPPSPSDLRLVAGRELPPEDIFALDTNGAGPSARPKPVIELKAPPKPPAAPVPVERPMVRVPLARPPLPGARRPPIVAQTSPLIALTRRQIRPDVDLDPVHLPPAKESARIAPPKSSAPARPVIGGDFSSKETTPVPRPLPPVSQLAAAPEPAAKASPLVPPLSVLDFSNKETTPVPRPLPPISKLAPVTPLVPPPSILDFSSKETAPVPASLPPSGLRPVLDPAAKETLLFQTPSFSQAEARPRALYTPNFPPLIGKSSAASPAPQPVPVVMDTEWKVSQAAEPDVPSESGDPELIEIFLPEARELLDDSESALLDWENGNAIEEKQRLLRRHMHTLKGAANSIGLTLLGGNVHTLEEFVTSRPAAEMPHRALDRLLKCVDEARSFVDVLESKGTAPWTADWTNLAQFLEPSPVPIATPEPVAEIVVSRETPVPAEPAPIFAEMEPRPRVTDEPVAPPEIRAETPVQESSKIEPVAEPEPVAPVGIFAEASPVVEPAPAAIPVEAEIAVLPAAEKPASVTSEVALPAVAETVPEPLIVEVAPAPVSAETAAAAADIVDDDDTPLDDPEMRTIFLDELQTLLEDFDRGLRDWRVGEMAEGGRQRVRRTLHTLRGASLSLGMDQLGDCSLAVESWVDRQPAAMPLGEVAIDALRRMLLQGFEYLDKLRSGDEDPGVLGWIDLIPAVEPTPVPIQDEEVHLPDSELPGEFGETYAPTPAPEPLAAAEPVQRVEPAILPQEEWERLVAESEPRRLPPKRAVQEEPARREQVLLQVDAKSLRGLLDITGELIIDRNRFDRNLDLLRDFRKGLAENRDRLLDTINIFQKEFEYTANRVRTMSRPGSRLGLPPVNENGNGSGYALPDGLYTGFGPQEPVTSRAADEFSDLEFDRYDQFNVLTRILQELVNDINEIGTGMERVTDTLSHENVEFAKMSRLLQDELASLNMLNFNGVFRRMQRTFRDALQADGKQGQLKFEGEETRLDRVILDKLYAPLMHLVRNTVAHGLESAGDRLAAGKAEVGEVTLKAYQLSHQVIIEVTDDGRGIDPEKIRAKAIERGLIPAAHGPLNWEEVLDMIFTPGFSTADTITSLAGRGVGLDVVKRDVEEMNGSLRLLSEPGKFCRWIIQLPLTLSAADAALIQIGGQAFALPLSYVDGGVHMRPDEVVEHDGHTYYRRGEELIPLSQLGPLLGLSRPVPHLQQAVIINTGGFRAAIGIERLIGREQIVIKSLGLFLNHHPLYSGATLDAEGRVMLILNAPHLASIIRSGQALAAIESAEELPEAIEEDRSLHVLVVDDSLSVRKSLEKHLVQFDCDVTLAVDGVDALDKMRNALFDVIFTDLEMPNMDGFQLLVEARGLELWAHVPMYVVTSRAVDKYTQKATSLGATGFLAKPVGAEQLRQVLEDVRRESVNASNQPALA